MPLVCCCPPAVSPGVWQGSDKETQRARQEAAGVSAKGSNCSKGPVPPPGSQLLARELFYKTLLWGVTDTYFKGTASDQDWQALAAPPLPEKGQCVPMTQAQLTHTGRDDPGLQVPSALENLLPHRAGKGSWRLHGAGCVGMEQDLQLQDSRWTARFQNWAS